MNKQAETLQALGRVLRILSKAKKNTSTPWVTQYIESPKSYLSKYMLAANASGMPQDTAEAIAQVMDGIDLDTFKSLPDFLPADMQGIVWLGYYQSADVWMPGKLREAVEKSGLTQQEVAEKIGATQSNVSEHLSGARKPRPEMLRRYEDALGLAPGALL